jgi:DNA modification methylase
MKIKPYYDDGKGIVLYCGDAHSILPAMPNVDICLTDPPYGIGEARGKNKSRTNLAVAVDYGSSSWDDSPVADNLIELCRKKSRWQIIFGGNFYTLPPSSCWLVWDKMNGANDFADAELAWTNLPKAVRMIHLRWNGMIREGHEPRYHPTQKPLKVIAWAISQAPKECGVILDPFMGSGTTLVAAKQLGRRAIGIEIESKYCDIAVKRIEQTRRPLIAL